MKDILTIFHDCNTHDVLNTKWSLSAQLEAFTGGYFVSGEGFDQWIKIYYKKDFDESKHIYDELVHSNNLIAYVSLSRRMALVLSRFKNMFQKDTAGYGLAYYPFDSFDKEEYFCSNPANMSKEFFGLRWINDDFLDDKNLDFDYEAFELIDSGIPYLNPNHFSIKELMKMQIDYEMIHTKKCPKCGHQLEFFLKEDYMYFCKSCNTLFSEELNDELELSKE